MKLKKSYALEQDNVLALQKFTKAHNFKNDAQALNFLLKSALNLPASFSGKVVALCESEIERLNAIDLGYDELYANNVINKDMQQILAFEHLMQRYAAQEDKFNMSVVEGTMRRSELAPGYGYAIYPKDWVVINEWAAANSRYGYVFEGRNCDKYGVPHFVYFSPVCYYDKPARDEICDEIYKFVESYSPECQAAFASQVEEKYEVDENGRRRMINREEWANAFLPAVWNLDIKGSLLVSGSDAFSGFPYGAHIVRPAEYDFEEDNRFLR